MELNVIWRPLSLSELNPMIFNTGLTHLGSEASICCLEFMKVITYLNGVKIGIIDKKLTISLLIAFSINLVFDYSLRTLYFFLIFIS